jgi:hypothetical protein
MEEWFAEKNAQDTRNEAFRGRGYNSYNATQKQHCIEINMYAQREMVKLLE